MDLLSIWESVVAEADKPDVRFRPSDEKLNDWLWYYGPAIAEEGIRIGMKGFLRKNVQVVTQEDALYMNNYIGACMRNLRDSITKVEEKAKAQTP